MKKLTIALAALVVLLSGVMVREYVTAPDNWINQIKAKQAFEKTQTLLVTTYRKSGEWGIDGDREI